ncbi:MAG TPA: hypothetical protein VFA52_03030 [Candidatus Paceibacterota bacterium]|nr:hypothetical protein [Candidatus Paceibacterota bacterium]
MALTAVSEKIKSRSEIFRLLNKYKVPWQTWGQGASRSLEAFFQYHEREKLYFQNHCGDQLIIHVHAAVVIVLHRYRGRLLEIYEDRQVCDNGTILRRSNFNGIGETMLRGEEKIKSAQRALQQELGFHDPSKYQLSDCLQVERRIPVESEKWPGIWAVYNRHIFQCVIPRELFKKDGHIEREDGRTIYFLWREADNQYRLDF